jgi:hypothetical protein
MTNRFENGGNKRQINGDLNYSIDDKENKQIGSNMINEAYDTSPLDAFKVRLPESINLPRTGHK